MITTFDKAIDAADEARFRANDENQPMAIRAKGGRLEVLPLTDTSVSLEVVHPDQNLADHIKEACRRVKVARRKEIELVQAMARAVQDHARAQEHLEEEIRLRDQIVTQMEEQ